MFTSFKRLYQKMTAALARVLHFLRRRKRFSDLLFRSKITQPNPNLKRLAHTEWLLKPKGSVKVLWLKRLAFGFLCIYSLVASYGWYQNHRLSHVSQHAAAVGGYVQQKFNHLQQLFSVESQKVQKAESALAIEKTSQNYLLAEIKKLRTENIELQKRLHFFEQPIVNNPNSTGGNASTDINPHSLQNHLAASFFKVTKSEASVSAIGSNLISQNYLSNRNPAFKNMPQKLLQIKAWLIQTNLKAFEELQPQILNAELELRYQVAGQLVIERYPEILSQNQHNGQNNNNINHLGLFKNIELKAYRPWLLDVELPKSAEIISTKLIFKHAQQEVVLDLQPKNNL